LYPSPKARTGSSTGTAPAAQRRQLICEVRRDFVRQATAKRANAPNTHPMPYAGHVEGMAE